MKRLFIYFTIFLLIIFIVIFLNFNKIKIKYLSKQTGYKESSVNILLKNSLFSSIENKEYSETLDKIINTIYFNKDLLNEYLNIFYIDRENFLNNINILLKKGYKGQEINTLFQKLSQNSINILLQGEDLSNIITMIEISYFKENNLQRYIFFYKKKQNKNIETIITNVNIGIDNKFYTNISNIEKEDDLLVLVNKIP